LARITNLFKLVASYVISRITRRARVWGLPAAASWEPNNTCNLRCPECPTGQNELTRPAGKSDITLFRSFIDQTSRHLAYLTLYFQGEPYLHENIFEMIRYARSRKIFVSTSTNGHFLTKENAEKTVASGLNRLIISLDGTDQEAYEKYRVNGKLDRVLEGVRNLVEAKRTARSKTPEIVIQFLVLRSNENQIPEIKKLAKSLGADRLELKSAQFYDYKNGNPLIPENKKYSRYKTTHQLTNSPTHQSAGLRVYELKSSLPRHCFRMWSSCVVTWDGMVVPCCYDKDATFRMGSLKEESFKTIWKKPEYDAFRQRILDGREKIEICSNCAEGMGVSRLI
jgi:radical SAM protein with 4Fe4S-binding SPASM domain